MDLWSLVSDLLKDQAIKAISKKTGLDEASAKSIAAKAMPALLWALKKNASDPKKAESLEKAVEKNDGSVLDNLESVDLEDWEKILGHVFGEDKEKIASQVGNKSVLAALAPMLMWALWKANSVTWKKAWDLLSSDWTIMKMATSFLDKDWDWSITDDLFDMAMKKFV
jgi:hypothetical protein